MLWKILSITNDYLDQKKKPPKSIHKKNKDKGQAPPPNPPLHFEMMNDQGGNGKQGNSHICVIFLLIFEEMYNWYYPF